MMRVYCDRCGRAEKPLDFFKDIEIRGYWESPGRGKTFTVCRKCAKEFKKDFMSYRYASSEAEGTAKAYMTEEGQIIISVGGEVIKDTFYLNVTVADTGIGISEENVEKIFAQFDRLQFDKGRSVEGSGLGLSITNSLVKQMGGTITVQSVEDSGSVFSVVIPQKIIGSRRNGIYTYTPEVETSNTVMKFTAPNARILAVDDNRMNLSVISGLLKRNGISPDVAFGGEEALTLCEKNKYDLILMDHMMPYPDGIETMHRIRNGKGVNEVTPIVVLTANVVSGARKRYMEEGFNDYLSKPIDVEKLETILLRYLTMEMTIEENVQPKVEERLPKEQGELISKETGLRFCGGSEELYNEILVSYCEEVMYSFRQVSLDRSSSESMVCCLRFVSVEAKMSSFVVTTRIIDSFFFHPLTQALTIISASVTEAYGVRISCLPSTEISIISPSSRCTCLRTSFGITIRPRSSTLL